MRRLLEFISKIATRSSIRGIGCRPLAMAMQDKPNFILLDRGCRAFRLRALPDVQFRDVHRVDSRHHREWVMPAISEITLRGARRQGIFPEARRFRGAASRVWRRCSMGF